MTGTGKTYTAVRICEMLDKTFSVERIVFSTTDLLDRFETCSKGEMIIFDEANEWNARTSMSKGNVIFSKILAMLRFTQISVIFTLPHLGMIDINGRRLMHNYLYTIPIDRPTCPPWMRDKSGAFWYNVESARLPLAGKTDIELRFKFPIIKGERVSKVFFKKASDVLLDVYESRKKLWFNEQLRQAQLGVQMMTKKAAAVMDIPEDVATAIEESPGVPQIPPAAGISDPDDQIIQRINEMSRRSTDRRRGISDLMT
jgi:hypothetical protein